MREDLAPFARSAEAVFSLLLLLIVLAQRAHKLRYHARDSAQVERHTLATGHCGPLWVGSRLPARATIKGPSPYSRSGVRGGGRGREGGRKGREEGGGKRWASCIYSYIPSYVMPSSNMVWHTESVRVCVRGVAMFLFLFSCATGCVGLRLCFGCTS
eukprot:scaffold5366_cov128-Isochrysis_galbana.AAC.7